MWPERGLEEGRVGHVVGVEDRDEGRVGERERVVDVARLRARVLLAPDVADAVARGQVAHRVVVAVVQHPDAHLGAAQARGGRDGEVDDVDRLLVDRHEHVDGHALAGRLRLADALRGAGPPEAERLDHVEDLGHDQQAVEVGRADPVGVQQPAEVPDGERQPDQRHDPHARLDADRLRHRLPGDLAQPDVPGSAAHRNSHTFVCGVSNCLSSLRWKSSLPSTRLVLSKKVWLSWKEARMNTGLPSLRFGTP